MFEPAGRVFGFAVKRRDNGVLSGKIESIMKSKGDRSPANKNQETPVKVSPPDAFFPSGIIEGISLCEKEKLTG
jgi:hypothetical protein